MACRSVEGGDFYVATSGDFLMATGSVDAAPDRPVRRVDTTVADRVKRAAPTEPASDPRAYARNA